MSLRRLVLTVAAMGLAAVALAALTPTPAEMAGALASAQRTVDAAGPDALVVAAAGLLAWVVWAWGALGLILTAASALPGVLGAAARLATHVVLPAGARRSAAVLLGLGLGVAAPLLATSTLLATPAVAAVTSDGVPDWPPAPPPGTPATAPPTSPAPAPAQASVPEPAPEPVPVPDRADSPTRVEEGSHVVVRGDCLWRIAATSLREQAGAPPSDGEIARAVHRWWTANADVIGPDPDLLLPGQVLRHPGPA